jgi:hypothetical protein
MEGILALLIPVLAMATGLVAVLRMPPERLGRGRGAEAIPAADTAALVDEVAMLREELARVSERLDFTERLLMDGSPGARLAAPADPLARAASTLAPARG